MKPLTLLVAALFALPLVVPGSSRAQAILAQSDFTSGVDGWTNVTLPYPSAIPPTELGTYAPAVIAGALTLVDPDGGNATGNSQYWSAPAKFLGDQHAAALGQLSFDVGDVGSGFGPYTQEDVLLVGATHTLVRFLGSKPGAALGHYAVALRDSAWHLDSPIGPAPTAAQVVEVLSSLTHLYIRAEYQLGPDTQSLDNVTLAGASAGVSEGVAAPVLELAPPAPNPAAGAMRFAFSLPRAGTADVAVFDASGRRVATLASGAFAAGPHTLAWSGRDAESRDVRAGLYWVRLAAGTEQVTRAFVRVR